MGTKAVTQHQIVKSNGLATRWTANNDAPFMIEINNSCYSMLLLTRNLSFDSSQKQCVVWRNDVIHRNPQEKHDYDIIVRNADEIIAAKNKNPNSDATLLKQEIDQLVYKLYGLTEEEKKIVEGK